jgi:hypothetical protein
MGAPSKRMGRLQDGDGEEALRCGVRLPILFGDLNEAAISRAPPFGKHSALMVAASLATGDRRPAGMFLRVLVFWSVTVRSS